MACSIYIYNLQLRKKDSTRLGIHRNKFTNKPPKLQLRLDFYEKKIKDKKKWLIALLRLFAYVTNKQHPWIISSLDQYNGVLVDGASLCRYISKFYDVGDLRYGGDPERLINYIGEFVLNSYKECTIILRSITEECVIYQQQNIINIKYRKTNSSLEPGVLLPAWEQCLTAAAKIFKFTIIDLRHSCQPIEDMCKLSNWLNKPLFVDDWKGLWYPCKILIVAPIQNDWFVYDQDLFRSYHGLNRFSWLLCGVVSHWFNYVDIGQQLRAPDELKFRNIRFSYEKREKIIFLQKLIFQITDTMNLQYLSLTACIGDPLRVHWKTKLFVLPIFESYKQRSLSRVMLSFLKALMCAKRFANEKMTLTVVTYERIDRSLEVANYPFKNMQLLFSEYFGVSRYHWLWLMEQPDELKLFFATFLAVGTVASRLIARAHLATLLQCGIAAQILGTPHQSRPCVVQISNGSYWSMWESITVQDVEHIRLMTKTMRFGTFNQWEREDGAFYTVFVNSLAVVQRILQRRGLFWPTCHLPTEIQIYRIVQIQMNRILILRGESLNYYRMAVKDLWSIFRLAGTQPGDLFLIYYARRKAKEEMTSAEWKNVNGMCCTAYLNSINFCII